MSLKNIGIIGCGNMGTAILRGIISNTRCKDFGLIITDLNNKRSKELSQEYSCSFMNVTDLVESSEIIILAVKPQDFAGLKSEIQELITHNKLIISVMAGVKISKIAGALDNVGAVVRAMPNMPGLIGEGVTCFSSNKRLKDTRIIKDIFGGIGKVLEVKEDLMDIVTAISGSGPAYFFYFVRSLIDAAKINGLDENMAKELVMETFYGSAEIMKRSDQDIDCLIDQVASKGGTTEAALKVFSDKDFDKIVSCAVKKAKKRSIELSEE